MERIHQKLVRDAIPEMIKKDGRMPITRVLTETEFRQELEKKLLEETQEVLQSNQQHRLEELADVLEVLHHLAYCEKISWEKIEQIAAEKRAKNGGFEKRIYLEKVIE